MGQGADRRPIDGIGRASRRGAWRGRRAVSADQSGRSARDGGHLVYAVGNSLLAAPFDVTRLELRGATAPIVELVNRSANSSLQSGVAQYDVSATGMLAYLPGRSSGASLPKVLAFADRDGKIQMLGLTPHPFIHPRLSPDGRHSWSAPTTGKTPMCGFTISSPVARCAGSRSAVATSIRFDARRPLHYLPIGSRRRRRHFQTTGRRQRSRRAPDQAGQGRRAPAGVMESRREDAVDEHCQRE